jgi:8-oxo-dGTP pyrophosphatase MutT (NUDIX family)
VEKVYDKDGNILKAGGIIINPNGELLLYKNADRGYSFPKGHVDPGEQVEETAIREIREETGLEVKIIRPLPDMSYLNPHLNKNVLIKMFLMEPISGELTPEEDGDELVWTTYVDALSYLDPNKKHNYKNLPQYLGRIKNEIYGQ